MEHPTEIDGDTIAAVATPPGFGGIGIVRLSGPRALEIGRYLFTPTLESADAAPPAPRTMHTGCFVDEDGDTIDRGLFLFMPAPASYTGEDVVELHGHGSPLVMERLLFHAVARGARIAEGGEFTRRAFMNGKLDLVQAEAVADLIYASSTAAVKIATAHHMGGLSRALSGISESLLVLLSDLEAAVDFPDDEDDHASLDFVPDRIVEIRTHIESLLDTFHRGRILTEGARVVIAGRPNVGKSSIMNLLLERPRSIVTSDPGTTRDTVEEMMVIGPVPVRLIDTCGVREALSAPEREGVARTLVAVEEADLVLVVIEADRPVNDDERALLSGINEDRCIVVCNKIDLVPGGPESFSPPDTARMTVVTSATAPYGIEELTGAIRSRLAIPQTGSSPSQEDRIVVSNARHFAALTHARSSLNEAAASAARRESPEFVSMDIRGALASLGDITGEVTADDVLDVIFSRFCVGK
ncbi:MAG: tRNA uridine-5-carboxymethylaminomethyl(34) synthesis GTPase MnmE [Deltaproteobacteria bacterium]|nr:tRNA uridine-5-carboxymethylaminomethyl(34) synthesis GTPase MnmE [Candidatus Zymogenaceae bacterium]